MINVYLKDNSDNINEAIYGLDIFTKNFCMDVKETNEMAEPVFRCKDCEFRKPDGKCLVHVFANNHKSDYPMNTFGSIT